MKHGKRVLSIFDKHGAIFDAGHVEYTSGLHGKMYIYKDLVWPHVEDVKTLASFIAEDTEHLNPDVVLTPKGGIYAVAHWTADYLRHVSGHNVLAVYAGKDKETGGFVLSHEYTKLIENRRILVLDDILNTSGTINRLIHVASEAGGKIAGAAVLINRSGDYVLQQIDAPEVCCLAEIFLPAWNTEEDPCPMCKAGVPLNTEVGKAKKTE